MPLQIHLLVHGTLSLYVLFLFLGVYFSKLYFLMLQATTARPRSRPIQAVPLVLMQARVHRPAAHVALGGTALAPLKQPATRATQANTKHRRASLVVQHAPVAITVPLKG